MAIELTTATAETLSGIREALSIPTSTRPAKDEADVLNLRSYSSTIMGGQILMGGQFFDKFQYLLDNENGSLNFSVMGGNVNGSPICPSILGNLASVTVNSSNLQVKNDGHGAYYSNYIDYLNKVFEKLGLYSTISGGSGSQGDTVVRPVFMKYYRSEYFNFIFKETATGLQNLNDSMIWQWKTIDGGFGVADEIGRINYTYDEFRTWYGSL